MCGNRNGEGFGENMRPNGYLLEGPCMCLLKLPINPIETQLIMTKTDHTHSLYQEVQAAEVLFVNMQIINIVTNMPSPTHTRTHSHTLSLTH